MQAFVKGSSGLEEVGRSKIRNYDDIAAVRAAIASGELKKDDLFTTIASHGITEDIMALINWIASVIPQRAGPENMVVLQDQLDNGVQTQINNLQSQIDALTASLADYASLTLVNQLGARVGVNENNICSLQECKFDTATFNTFYSNEYTSLVTSTNTAIANLTDCDSCLRGDLTLLSNRVTCAETNISNLQSCPGLNCKGTVTGIYNQVTSNTYTPNTNGIVTLNIADFTLSGTTLTIRC